MYWIRWFLTLHNYGLSISINCYKQNSCSISESISHTKVSRSDPGWKSSDDIENPLYVNKCRSRTGLIPSNILMNSDTINYNTEKISKPPPKTMFNGNRNHLQIGQCFVQFGWVNRLSEVKLGCRIWHFVQAAEHTFGLSHYKSIKTHCINTYFSEEMISYI